MSAAPNWYEWAGIFGVVAAGAGLIVLMAATAARWAPAAAYSRMIWRVAVAVLLVVPAGEVTGVSRGIVRCALTQSALLFRASSKSGDSVVVPTERRETESDLFSAHWSAETIDDEPVQSPALSLIGDAAGVPAFDTIFRVALADFMGRSTWWPGIVWGLVALLLGMRRVISGLLGMIGRTWHLPQSDTELSRRLHELAARFGLTRVRDVVVPGITGPIAFGFVRPTVGLPPRFTHEFDATQQAAMLAHELEHLAARDPAWFFLTDLLAAVLWWHPLVWWARRQFRVASEWAADEASLLVPDGPDVLADCLVHLGGRLVRAQQTARLGIEGGGFRSDLGRRVTRLLSLSDHVRRRPPGFWSLCTRLLVTVAMVVAALVSTGWSTVEAIPKGETMRLTLQQSWRHSLVAAALLSALGNGRAPAAGVDFPIEAFVGVIGEPAPQKDGDDRSKQVVAESEAAIREKLDQIKARVEELKLNGRDEEAEKLARDGKKLRAVLDKIGDKKVLIAEKLQSADGKEKKSLDSIDALKERLKQLEEENAKLRAALAGKVGGQSDKSREDIERALKELHEKFSREKYDLAKKEDFEQARMLFEQAVRERPKMEELKQKEAAVLREKIERLQDEKAKMKEKGRAEDAEKLDAEKRKLAEFVGKVGKAKGDADFEQSFGPHMHELGATIKELREEVSRLRSEVAELRHIVKEGGESKEQKRQIR